MRRGTTAPEQESVSRNVSDISMAALWIVDSWQLHRTSDNAGSATMTARTHFERSMSASSLVVAEAKIGAGPTGQNTTFGEERVAGARRGVQRTLQLARS